MKYLKKNSQNSLPKVIIDTNTLFSALYNPDGNEAFLLELADEGKCCILILDYVLDELRNVFNRKEIDFKLVTDLLVCSDEKKRVEFESKVYSEYLDIKYYLDQYNELRRKRILA